MFALTLPWSLRRNNVRRPIPLWHVHEDKTGSSLYAQAPPCMLRLLLACSGSVQPQPSLSSCSKPAAAQTQKCGHGLGENPRYLTATWWNSQYQQRLSNDSNQSLPEPVLTSERIERVTPYRRLAEFPHRCSGKSPKGLHICRRSSDKGSTSTTSFIFEYRNGS